ncbi:uncharacterized protein BXIN_0738 [Babesia sp. Xinjiang]|uniref:uncharacterized protein n=1 Tax=Babesia sp. Xinjiang TaxID=462227 RepID=UPI000A231DD9|nr:uncharacterized protein BXIN_0738 [Babesia sp. Xinjiang]ORM41359.1 hypothetical protein BXIN_0738 [Babesia sp. Xinjiang]
MEDDFLNIDPRSQMPALCNYEMMKQRVGSLVRVIGRIIAVDKKNIIIQTPDGGKVTLILSQQDNFQIAQVVEVRAVVRAETRQKGSNIYLQQYGQMYIWGNKINMELLNTAIKLLNHPKAFNTSNLIYD